MQFKLVFKHTYEKHFGDILCIYEADELYLRITKDKGEFYCCLLNKELNKSASIKDYIVDTSFPEILKINVDGISFKDTDADNYIRQCINSKGLNVEFTKNATPPRNLAKLFFFMFLGTLVSIFIFKEIRTYLIVADALLFVIMFFFLIKHSNISISNREIDYFSTLKDKNILDELYLLYKEDKLKSLFFSVDYIKIEINKYLRPELTIYNLGKKNYCIIEIDDEYVKYAVVDSRIEDRDVSEEAFIKSPNCFATIDEVIALTNSLDIDKTTLTKKLSKRKGISK